MSVCYYFLTLLRDHNGENDWLFVDMPFTEEDSN